MLKQYRAVSRLVLLTAVIIVLLSLPAEAAVTGFVVEDQEGGYFKYHYQELLDSYALKVLGQSNGLYEDFAAKKPFALFDNKKGYLDYQAVMDQYARAMIEGKSFDLHGYTESGEAKEADMPGSVELVELNEGKLLRISQTLDSGSGSNNPDFKPPGSKTEILGLPRASVQQAQEWAEGREAHERLIDIAPLYWEYGEKTGIRPEVLYAQAAVETEFGAFSNNLPPEFNNWAGIRTAEASGSEASDYEKFGSPEDGVRAHFNHISAYVGLDPIGEPHQRFHLVLEEPWAGSVFFVDDLPGKWSSSSDYHIKILMILEQIAQTENPAEPEEPEEETTDEEPKERDSEAEPGDDEKVKYHVTVDVPSDSALRLRSGPSTDHDILTRLTRGTVLEVTGNQDEWLAVITPEDKNGWVHGDYVKEVNLTENPFKGKTVAVDPGHGGSDPGAIGASGLREKEVNLAVALELAALLEEAGAEVVMTRSGDHSVRNARRVEVANEAEADVFVSIHANAYSDPESNGTETYYCSENDHSSASRYLAEQVQREMVSALGLRDRGVKQRSFYVLKNTEMPAVLVELGFLTNATEEKLLEKNETHVKAARALFEGLEAYLQRYR